MSGDKSKLKLKLKVEGSAVEKALKKFHISDKGMKPAKVKVDRGEDKSKDK